MVLKSDFSSDLFIPFLTIIGRGAQPMIGGGGARALPDINRGKWGKADYLRNSMQYFLTECLYLTKDFSIG